jgi:hypothetical protein
MAQPASCHYRSPMKKKQKEQQLMMMMMVVVMTMMLPLARERSRRWCCH